MAGNKAKIEKIFFTIGEVAQMLDVTPTSIRYWENHFEELAPRKSTKGTRLFSQSDIEILKLIHYLVKEKGMTIKGAANKLKYNRESTVQSLEVVTRLKVVRDELVQILKAMEG